MACMCGADDCDRCHPGSTRWVECSRCGARAQMWEADGNWDIKWGDDEGVCDLCCDNEQEGDE